MKKTFDSFAPCLELREVIFLRQLPAHQHLVPALDIFLDPHTKRLHICMEYMDGNLYQLMKAREGKLLEGSVVKSVLYVHQRSHHLDIVLTAGQVPDSIRTRAYPRSRLLSS